MTRLVVLPLKGGSIQDNFDENLIDANIWTVNQGPGTYVDAHDGVLSLQYVDPPVGEGNITSIDHVDLTDSAVFVEVPKVINLATTAHWQSLRILDPNTNDWVEMTIFQGATRARKSISGTISNLFGFTYSATSHRWWRIRSIGSNTQTYFDTSPDGLTWDNWGSVTNPISLTDVQIQLVGGSTSVEANPGEGQFDNLNVTPPPLFSPTYPLLSISRAYSRF